MSTEETSDQAKGSASAKRPVVPIVHVISDSLGDTATGVILAAAGQFDEGAVRIERLPKVTDVSQVRRYLDRHPYRFGTTAVFHTIVDPELRRRVRAELDSRDIPSVDLIGPAISVLQCLVHEEPKGIAGAIHKTDEQYFARIEAMEFFVDHDDGRNPEELPLADIVLIGVSRTSKTPLSMYLAFQGFKVANVPLAPDVIPPAELEQCDPARVFGLLSTTDTLAEIRFKRLHGDAALSVAGRYAEPAEIQSEQAQARTYMRSLGCVVIHTEHRAVEETATEIIDHVRAVERARAARSADAH